MIVAARRDVDAELQGEACEILSLRSLRRELRFGHIVQPAERDDTAGHQHPKQGQADESPGMLQQHDQGSDERTPRLPALRIPSARRSLLVRHQSLQPQRK